MISERDVWGVAKMHIDQHGTEAPIHAAMKADKMLELGDMDGQLVWKAIVRAINGLLNKEPDGTVH
jgi:hypothetical protein